MKLNKAQLKALAEGATTAQVMALASVSDDADDATVAAAIAAATGVPAVAAPAAAPAAGEGTGGAAPAVAADEGTAPVVAAVVPPAAPVANELVTHLQAQIAEKDSALITARVEAEGFKAQAAAVDGLVATLRAALGEKLVALGSSAEAAAGFTASNIVAEFTRIDAVFKNQFRVGAVAAVPTPEAKQPVAASIDPILAAAMQNSLVK